MLHQAQTTSSWDPMPPKAAGKTAAKAAAKGAAKAAAPAGKAAAKAAPKAAGTGAVAAKVLRDTKEEEKEEKDTEPKQDKAEDQKPAEETAPKEDEKTKEEEAKLEEQRKAEEAERERKKLKANGNVVLKYSMYDEKFPIKDGKITAAEIDETYCLSDVMPGCKIHLSSKPSEEKYKMESAGEVFPYIFEEPLGTFHDLEADETYYVFVEEDETEFLKSQEKAKQNFMGVKSAKTRGEGCSCIEGNPCAQECDAQGNSICHDWANRFAVAKAHGWLGYQAK